MIDYHAVSQSPNLLQAGLRCRHPKLGPELDMVLEYVTGQLPPAGPGERREILLEPHVCTSYPDAVILYWDEEAGTRLRTKFDGVRVFDLQILSALSHSRSWSMERVRTTYGKQAIRSIARLENAGAVVLTGSRVSAAPLDELFALRRVIALEAKMRDWSCGLAQALHNTWFTTESYLLLHTMPKRRTPHDEAERLGIGILGQDTPILGPQARMQLRLRRQPSVGAWLLNTWAAALT